MSVNIIILWAVTHSFNTHITERYFFSIAHLLTASVKRVPGLECRCAVEHDPSITQRFDKHSLVKNVDKTLSKWPFILLSFCLFRCTLLQVLPSHFFTFERDFLHALNVNKCSHMMLLHLACEGD